MMTRENVEALVKLGAPITTEELREVGDCSFVSKIEGRNAWGANGGTFIIDAVHFTSNSAGFESPRSHPDAITNPLDPPTVDGTTIERPI